MLRKCLLVVLAVSLLGCSKEVVAQPPNTGPPDVRIMLRPGAAPSDPRIIVVGPRAAGVCINTPDCPDSFNVRWVNAGNPGSSEMIRIKFTTLGANLCFDNTDFTIDANTPMQTVKVLNEPLCKKEFFPFMISCEGGDGNNCGGVGPVDPGAMIDD